MQIGIDRIHFATSSQIFDLKDLAEARSVDPDKYTIGIGQDKMSMAGEDEDIVTLGANAALPIVERHESNIDALLFATESSVDQSKSAGVHVHELLELNSRCRVVELKHACYSGTAALQMAVVMVARNPKQSVLVIASDIARYELESPGESTQGCGAVAMLVKANPSILAIEPDSGLHTQDVMDFWRPNYSDTAMVDGKYSAKVYLDSLKHAWLHFQEVSGMVISDIQHFCYHLPFTKMAEKAHARLLKVNKTDHPKIESLKATLQYNRIVGNSYTASLYIGFCSLLDNAKEDLANQRVGFFSYGSGCVAEFFSGLIQPGYKERLLTESHQNALSARRTIDYPEYLALYKTQHHSDGQDFEASPMTCGAFRFSGIKDHKRLYERNESSEG